MSLFLSKGLLAASAVVALSSTASFAGTFIDNPMIGGIRVDSAVAGGNGDNVADQKNGADRFCYWKRLPGAQSWGVDHHSSHGESKGTMGWHDDSQSYTYCGDCDAYLRFVICN